MIIEVTEQDIKNGERRESFTCPIARAIQRATGNPNILVGVDDWYAWTGQSAPPRLLPASARKFIQQFDRGAPVKPFSFRLKRDN